MGRRGEGCFFDDDVGVRARVAERVDGSAARRIAGGLPVRELAVKVKGTAGEIDLRLRSLEVQARRDHSVVERLDDLDEAGHAGGRIQMPDVRLDRPYCAEPLLIRPRA